MPPQGHEFFGNAMRGPYIESEDSVDFVEFDWASKDGESRYPAMLKCE